MNTIIYDFIKSLVNEQKAGVKLTAQVIVTREDKIERLTLDGDGRVRVQTEVRSNKHACQPAN
jgi:hypothetical protein